MGERIFIPRVVHQRISLPSLFCFIQPVASSFSYHHVNSHFVIHFLLSSPRCILHFSATAGKISTLHNACDYGGFAEFLFRSVQAVERFCIVLLGNLCTQSKSLHGIFCHFEHTISVIVPSRHNFVIYKYLSGKCKTFSQLLPHRWLCS